MGRYRQAVRRAIEGSRGQAFLRELAAAMDAMEDKVLIADELIDADGDCCAIGVVCKARELDVSNIDPDDSDAVAELVGIAPSMAAEIAFENDDDFACHPGETNKLRWNRMREWVGHHILEP